jgi:hypothetical protein
VVTDEVDRVSDAADVAKMVRACDERLKPSAGWKLFPGYPGSLALCVIDAIWSINARYPITRGVIQRYRNRRRWRGSADEDGLPELLGLYEALGGVDAFIDEVGTRNRVSTQPNAVRKGEAVFQAAKALHDLGVDTADQFRDADGRPLGNQLKQAWCAIPGQGSGVSWRYLRMLVGLPDVKPDRMVLRFIASALGVDESSISADYAVALVQATADHFGVDQRALDHEIWEYQRGRRAGHDQVNEHDQLAAVAHSFIGAVFPALQEAHVIPTPRYHPYVQVGRDYYGPDVRGPEHAELEAMLQTEYPERFADPLKREHPEFPSDYTFSFLEGAITKCAKAGGDQYEADTPPVQEAVEELIRVLDSPRYTVTCCRAISHLTTKEDEPVTIGDITIYPESSTRGLLERTRDFIPSAASAFNREQPSFYDPPHSLVVTSVMTENADKYGVASGLTRAVDRFLLVARLLYAGTHESAWQVTGTSTLISRLHPLYRQFRPWGMPNLLMQRVVELAPDNAPAITALGDFLDAAAVKRDKMVATSFDIALRNYARSSERGDYYERIIDLATALEAILTGGEDETEGIGLRLRTRAAALLWTESDSGRAIYDDVKTLYNLRSKVVHGSRIAAKDLLKWLKAVSTVPDNAMYGVAFSFAVDRLRDLVRRSFLARLCLASGDEPLWKFEASAPVDAALSDAMERAKWRQSWRDTLTSLGVAEAANPAIRAIDPLGRAQPASENDGGNGQEEDGSQEFSEGWSQS